MLFNSSTILWVLSYFFMRSELNNALADSHLPSDFLAKYSHTKFISIKKYASVSEYIEKSSNLTWAAKFIEDVNDGVKEYQIMKQLNHTNIIQLHEAFAIVYDDDALNETSFAIDDERIDEIVLVMELGKGGDLHEYITKNKLNETQAKQIIRQILKGVQHMHERGIVHRDLKPQNIVFMSLDRFELKIIDFGVSFDIKSDNRSPQGYTFPYCAPEVYDDSGNSSFSTDMWSIGVITYELLSGDKFPYHAASKRNFENIFYAEVESPSNTWNSTSPEAQDFITELLIKDQRKRMTMDKALKHPWITQ